jgi:ABC-type cobalamin/Fe3+-siderophores transport system ATPase subunit
MKRLRIIIEGEAGTGKTTLLQFIAHHLERQGCEVVVLDQRREMQARADSLPWVRPGLVEVFTRTPGDAAKVRERAREVASAEHDGEQKRRRLEGRRG